MKLKKADIIAFRSIAKETIEFTPQFRILVGINESGKTNVLRALNLLSRDSKPKATDERTVLPEEEGEDQKSFVNFYFDCTKEKEELEQMMNSHIYNSNRKTLFSIEEEPFTIKKVLDPLKETKYIVDISNEKKEFDFTLPNPEEIEVSLNLMKPSPNCPEDFTFVNRKKENIVLHSYNFLFLTEEEKKDIPDEYLTMVTGEEIIQYIKISFEKILELPEVVFWEYHSDQLLQPSINIESFINDPSTCVPLENMFKLAKIENISEMLMKNKNKGYIDLKNFLQQVATKNTAYFKEKWKEYDEISFSLEPDGENIRCSVTEKNTYSFDDRSDGFKRFVAFLLSISCRSKINSLNNALILIDEPDNGLHPTGIRYLRDELKSIAQKNIVVCSTHSIFMIDNHNIPRHIIVKKSNEITHIETAKEGNINKEEVIYQALNLTLYEILKETNVIFEGWRDRKLIEAFMRRNSSLSRFYKKIGIGHAYGASSFKNYIPMLELAGRKTYIISDNDNNALKEKEEYEKLKYKTPWYSYPDITPKRNEVTGEDFLKKDYIVKKANKLFEDENLSLSLSEDSLPDKNILNHIKEKIETLMSEEQAISLTHKLKESLFDKDLTASKIRDTYSELLEELKKIIEQP